MSRRAKPTEPGAFDERMTRSYWRSAVVHLCMHNAGLLAIVPIGTREIRELPPRAYCAAIPKCQRLIDELSLAEKNRGARRQDDERYANEQLHALLKLYAPRAPLAAGETATLDLERST